MTGAERLAITLDWRVVPLEQLDAELVAIREFADWLRETYPTLLGDVIKPCWPLHADMRFSLAAFRVAWREAMARADRGDMGISVIHWEDELERARARWAQSMQGCEDGECARERVGGPMANTRARGAALDAAEKVDGAACAAACRRSPPSRRRGGHHRLRTARMILSWTFGNEWGAARNVDPTAARVLGRIVHLTLSRGGGRSGR
jgi:hypothetical protein